MFGAPPSSALSGETVSAIPWSLSVMVMAVLPIGRTVPSVILPTRLTVSLPSSVTISSNTDKVK